MANIRVAMPFGSFLNQFAAYKTSERKNYIALRSHTYLLQFFVACSVLIMCVIRYCCELETSRKLIDPSFKLLETKFLTLEKPDRNNGFH